MTLWIWRPEFGNTHTHTHTIPALHAGSHPHWALDPNITRCQRTSSIASWKLPVSYFVSPLRPRNPGKTGGTPWNLMGLPNTLTDEALGNRNGVTSYDCMIIICHTPSYLFISIIVPILLRSNKNIKKKATHIYPLLRTFAH